MKWIIYLFLITLLAVFNCTSEKQGDQMESTESTAEWISLFNGKNLDGWFVRGNAQWEVQNGILTGIDGMGHIYAGPVLTDLEVKGMFRVSENGNSGLYFRCNPPEDNPDGFPRGYEAQIDNHSEAHTGWLWKPGNPTAKAAKLIT